MLKVIKNGSVYAPSDRGVCDIVVLKDSIVSVATAGEVDCGHLECETYDAGGKFVFPGIIDPHVHVIGGGGAGGLNSRVSELPVEEIVEAGVTTVVGCLGFDKITKNLKTLLAKTIGLTRQGISAYMMVGSYNLPSLTIMGSVEEDLALIDQVIGVKLALGESLGNWPQPHEIKNLLAECLRGGKLGGKAGFVQVHLGSRGEGLQEEFVRLCDEMNLPPSRGIFTHCNRSAGVLEESAGFIKSGGFIDLTASFSSGEKEAVRRKGGEPDRGGSP